MFDEDININSQEYARMKRALNYLLKQRQDVQKINFIIDKCKKFAKTADKIVFWYLYLILTFDAAILRPAQL